MVATLGEGRSLSTASLCYKVRLFQEKGGKKQESGKFGSMVEAGLACINPEAGSLLLQKYIHTNIRKKVRIGNNKP